MKSFLNTLEMKCANISDWCRARRAGRALRKSAAKAGNMADLIALAFEFDYRGIKLAPMQIRSEITALLKLLEPSSPRRVMEIGAASGGTFFLLSRAAPEDAQLITVDLPNGPFAQNSYPWPTSLMRSFRRPRQKIHALRADSHRAKTLARVKELLRGEPLDFLFIDGDHRYDSVKADFAMYTPLVRKGGLIALHDIVPGDEQYVGGVPVFWRELKQGRRAREFVESWDQGGYGIGLLEKDF